MLLYVIELGSLYLFEMYITWAFIKKVTKLMFLLEVFLLKNV